MQATALQLVEIFANGGETTAVPLQAPATAAVLCRLVTSHHILTPLGSEASTPAGGTPGPESARSITPQASLGASADHVFKLAEPLAALRCLRLIATHQASGSAASGQGGKGSGAGSGGVATGAPGGFASHIFRAGLYPALSRHLTQAAALAVPMLQDMLADHFAAPGDAAAGASGASGAVNAGASTPRTPVATWGADASAMSQLLRPQACRNARQNKARRALLDRLPAPHSSAETPLGALIGELAMWAGIGADARRTTGAADASNASKSAAGEREAGERGAWMVRADVASPLLSAVFDCFAAGGKAAFILEQPADNLLAEHEYALHFSCTLSIRRSFLRDTGFVLWLCSVSAFVML